MDAREVLSVQNTHKKVAEEVGCSNEAGSSHMHRHGYRLDAQWSANCCSVKKRSILDIIFQSE